MAADPASLASWLIDEQMPCLGDIPREGGLEEEETEGEGRTLALAAWMDCAQLPWSTLFCTSPVGEFFLLKPSKLHFVPLQK